MYQNGQMLDNNYDVHIGLYIYIHRPVLRVDPRGGGVVNLCVGVGVGGGGGGGG